MQKELINEAVHGKSRKFIDDLNKGFIGYTAFHGIGRLLMKFNVLIPHKMQIPFYQTLRFGKYFAFLSWIGSQYYSSMWYL